jgi:ankyrin repeat protein
VGRAVSASLLLGALLAARSARADYYNGYFPYYGSRPEPPIISLELDPKASLDTNMRVAAREDRLADLKRFLQSGANVNSRSDTGETALMYAARNCSERIVSCLLDAHAEENLQDDRGRTALMFASSDSCLPVVRLLLHGHAVNISARDREGRNALDYARRASALEYGGDSEEIVRLLKSRARQKPVGLSSR